MHCIIILLLLLLKVFAASATLMLAEGAYCTKSFFEIFNLNQEFLIMNQEGLFRDADSVRWWPL